MMASAVKSSNCVAAALVSEETCRLREEQVYGSQ